MVSDRRRVSSYFATYDVTSPEYAIVRAVAFGVTSLVFLALALFTEPFLGLFAGLCALATLVWVRRWRRAIRDDEAVK